MPQNLMANQQVYIQVAKKIYESTWKRNLWNHRWLSHQDVSVWRQHTQAQINLSICFSWKTKHSQTCSVLNRSYPVLQIGQFIQKTHFQSRTDIHKQKAVDVLQALSYNDFGRCWKACVEHSVASNGKLSITQCNVQESNFWNQTSYLFIIWYGSNLYELIILTSTGFLDLSHLDQLCLN